MTEPAIIPDFDMYEDRLTQSEKDEMTARISATQRSGKDRFVHFTDILSEYLGSGEWKNLSDGFLAMCAKAAFLRGLYGYNQMLAKATSNIICKGYAAAAYCLQSLDPRWINNLRTYVNQVWQMRDHIAFAELSGQLASILVDLGYTERAREVLSESIDKVTKATTKNEAIRNKVQAALLRSRILMADIDLQVGSREESLMRLDSAEDTARLLDLDLAQTDIRYYRAKILDFSHEYERATDMLNGALRKYERMGYLQGVANAKNLQGVIFMERGYHQEARDVFEELLIVQQQLNNQIGLAKTLINVGEIDRGLEQYEQMELYNQRALEISQEAEYMRGIATAKVNMGDVAFHRGDFEDAISFYEDSMAISNSSGMNDIQTLCLFLKGDALFMLQRYEDALNNYKKAHEFANANKYPVESFSAVVSTVVAYQFLGRPIDSKQIAVIRDMIGSYSEWLNESDSSLMRDVRSRVYQDSTIESDLCIFYDREKNFECRVERESPRTGCAGNLFWKGTICPYFMDFLHRIDENA